uniref:Glutamyl-tRNA reductase n=2 Tax=Desulfatirhabdium butyrativorans TaxID=340467 RepID=A0A7C4RRQ3_9BACT
MIDIVVLGLNHKTADISIRECLAFSPLQTEDALERFRSVAVMEEVVMLSTCNRVEVILASHDPEAAIDVARRCLSEWKAVEIERFASALYNHRNDEAVRHVFRVASSLDSMVVGEPQILGQLKHAYRLATEKKTSGVVLNRLMHRAFSVAKRVRTETGIGDHAVSISYAAIELAKKIFGSLEGKNVLLIGAGEMAELAVEHLIRNRCGDIRVANRTLKRAMELAQRFRGQAVGLEEIPDCLVYADIVISSTGASDLVVTRDQVRAVMRPRRNKPIFFIDIAVPRDIDPEIHKLPNAYVYDIDDLQGVVDENIQDRQKEAQKAERIIDEAVIQFRSWMESLDAVPTIVSIRQKIEAIADAEMQKTFHQHPHWTEADRQAVQRMTQALINKMLHEPTQYLRRNGAMGNLPAQLDVVRKLFHLDPE